MASSLNLVICYLFLVLPQLHYYKFSTAPTRKGIKTSRSTLCEYGVPLRTIQNIQVVKYQVENGKS